MAMNGFKKRTYHSIGQPSRELWYLLRHRKQVRALVRGRSIAPSFRERLMLAVTGVNDCRYCSFFHVRVAARTGVSSQEAALLLGGIFRCPDEELPALVYAQHWAETEGQPEPITRQHLVATYGEVRAEAIDLALRMIRVGNLLGNTGDYILYRLSFGRLGLSKGG